MGDIKLFYVVKFNVRSLDVRSYDIRSFDVLTLYHIFKLFCVFYGHLVHFSLRFGMLLQENLATLAKIVCVNSSSIAVFPRIILKLFE
jgi:hypothetical protein